MKSKILKMAIIIILLLAIIDQGSKFLVIKYFSDFTSTSIVRIELVKNTGMAFGFNDGNTRNIVLSIIVLLIVLNFMKSQKELIDNKTYIALFVIIAGGLSNLIDRIFRQGIIDFIKIYTFPNFNLADIYIVIGWILIVIFLVRFTYKKDTEKSTNEEKGENSNIENEK